MTPEEFSQFRWTLVFLAMLFLFVTGRIDFAHMEGLVVGALVPTGEIINKLGLGK